MGEPVPFPRPQTFLKILFIHASTSWIHKMYLVKHHVRISLQLVTMCRGSAKSWHTFVNSSLEEWQYTVHVNNSFPATNIQELPMLQTHLEKVWRKEGRKVTPEHPMRMQGLCSACTQPFPQSTEDYLHIGLRRYLPRPADDLRRSSSSGPPEILWQTFVKRGWRCSLLT